MEVPGKIVDTCHESTCGVWGLFVGGPEPACPMCKLDTLLAVSSEPFMSCPKINMTMFCTISLLKYTVFHDQCWEPRCVKLKN